MSAASNSTSFFLGMENGWVLVREIQNGCRMEKLEYSPNFLGEIMKNCWQKNPNERPTFSQLAGVIEKQIETAGQLRLFEHE
jgi:hypothetical protein